MPDDWKFENPKFLLCEGDHDKQVLEFLITERKLGSFQIRTTHECVGKGGASGFGLAIEGFPAITGQLKKHGFVPGRSIYGGWISRKPLLIIPLPSATEYGDLEKLCLPALYSLWPDAEECVTAYLECTGAIGWEKQNQLWKAKVRCAISGYYEKDPYKGLGYLFKDKKLRHLAFHSCFDRLVSVLKNFDDVIKNPDILGD